MLDDQITKNTSWVSMQSYIDESPLPAGTPENGRPRESGRRGGTSLKIHQRKRPKEDKRVSGEKIGSLSNIRPTWLKLGSSVTCKRVVFDPEL